MKKIRAFKTAVALGTLTAAVALLAGAPDAGAQAPPGGGSFPGSFLVPGTNTSVKFGGYAKLDYVDDFSAKNSDTNSVSFSGIAVQGPNATAAQLAAHSAHGNTRLDAKQSRFNFDTRTPTAYGNLTTFVELDLFSTSTSSGTSLAVSQVQSNREIAGLRHAFGTLGPLLAGQTWSLWVDTNTIMETLDFNGPAATTVNRQPQIRFTYAMPNGVSAALSVENPEADFFVNATGATNTTNSTNGVDRAPDGVVALRVDQAWGDVQLNGLVRDLAINNTTLPHHSTVGYGGAASTKFNLSTVLPALGKDAVIAKAMWGKGIGRYIQDAGGQAVELSTGGTSLRKVQAWGWWAGIQHWWTSNLRTNALGSMMRINNSNDMITSAASLAVLNKDEQSVHANLIWSPVPQVDLGVEYIWGRHEVQNGSSGNLNRLDVAAIFKF